ncbi:hypothetical protein GW17_00007679 [Ensete ventricosum]|uniref:Uncharacterized protein n=1 Tax=Ensete ventricosum TaxID=4639 RepID=A0A444FYY2_ENSVE|nr:hypothetical protein GW17_00007679 [Ensete ventricosum]RZR72404.1 hypothetical protein BHM03_00013259 [Ensete ventricosum]
MLPIFPRSIRSLSALSIKLMRFIPTSLVISSLLDPLRTSSVQDYKVSSLYLYRKLLIFLYDRFRINDLPHFHRVSSPKKHRELFLRDWQHPSSGCCQRWERFHVTVIHEGEGVRVGVAHFKEALPGRSPEARSRTLRVSARVKPGDQTRLLALVRSHSR